MRPIIVLPLAGLWLSEPGGADPRPQLTPTNPAASCAKVVAAVLTLEQYADLYRRDLPPEDLTFWIEEGSNLIDALRRCVAARHTDPHLIDEVESIVRFYVKRLHEMEDEH